MMRDLIDEVLRLQSVWTSKNTPDMQRRGEVIRHDMKEWLGARSLALSEALSVPVLDLGIEGSDGIGLRSQIPWIRVHSISGSPSATQGWYVVYLFGGDGQRCYLTLMQGTMNWDGSTMTPRPARELKDAVHRARICLGPRLQASHLVSRISLAAQRSKAAAAYELGAVCAIQYGYRAAPPDDELVSDLELMLRLLAIVHADCGSRSEDSREMGSRRQFDLCVDPLASDPTLSPQVSTGIRSTLPAILEFNEGVDPHQLESGTSLHQDSLTQAVVRTVAIDLAEKIRSIVAPGSFGAIIDQLGRELGVPRGPLTPARERVIVESASAIRASPHNLSPTEDVPDPPPDRDYATVKAFVEFKAPRTKVERLVCLVYWATAGGGGAVQVRDLNNLNRKVGGDVFSDAGSMAQTALAKSYLARNGLGQLAITATGAELVESLPVDR